MSIKWRYIIIETIAGPKEVKAPFDWDYDMTARIAWNKMVNIVHDLDAKQNARYALKRDILALKAQLRVLANVLSNSIGMSDFYWEQAAIEIAKLN